MWKYSYIYIPTAAETTAAAKRTGRRRKIERKKNAPSAIVLNNTIVFALRAFVYTTNYMRVFSTNLALMRIIV